MSRNSIIILSLITLLSMSTLLIVNLAYPELIGHPDKCNITVIHSRITSCNYIQCIKLLVIIHTTDKTGYGNIDCDPPLINCTDTYNNIVIPCLYHDKIYDLKKYNIINVVTAVISIIIIIMFISVLITTIYLKQ
jgi:hypothetical protein